MDDTGPILDITVYTPLFSPSYDTGDNLLSNPSFEAPGASPPVFSSWSQDLDGGALTLTRASTTPDPNSGSYYCEMYSVSATGGGHIYQDVTVTPGNYYRLTLYSRIDTIYADQQGRIGIYDVTNAEWIISKEPTGLFSNQEWQQGSFLFTAPIGCTTVRIYLYQSVISDTYVHYDDVELTEVQSGATATIWEIGSDINDYQHSITANIGFDSMSFSTAGDQAFLEDWVENGLGRHVVVTSPGGGIIWEGFVNQVDMRIGSFTMRIGPMKDIINRARVAFNELDYAGLNPVGGDQVNTQWIDNLPSMARYGVLEGIISGGDGTNAEMVALLQSLFTEISWPPSESSFSMGSASGDLGVSISCLGYGHLLEKYFYSQQAVAGTANISDKLLAILRRSPNNLFTATSATIETNAFQVGVYEDGTKTALAIIKELSNLGGAADDTRHIFGVYENRTFYYSPVSPAIVYTTRLADGRLELATGGFPDPWLVRPGVWLNVDDIFVGSGANFYRPSEDPRRIFIEGISYSAPYSLNIRGGRASTFRQRLDRLGIGGI